MQFINLHLIEYAINSILRQKNKNFFVLIILTLLIAILSSTFFITHSIKNELEKTLKPLPDITIQKLIAGRHVSINKDIINELVQVSGIKSVTSRTWGYYYFQNAGVNFSIVGVDQYDKQYKKNIANIIEKYNINDEKFKTSMLVGSGVKKILDENYYKEYFNFILPDSSILAVNIAGIFDSNIELQSNDMIIMPQNLASKIFHLDENMATDIVINVANEDEIFTIASKLAISYPNLRVITKKELAISYENIFDYKSGIFLLLFIVSLFTFSMIVYDRISGLSSSEKKEIGILKALGWKISDILKQKFYEGFIISTLAYILGIFIALVFVFVFNAPILKEAFIGYSMLKTSFDIPFYINIQTLILIFLLSVPIYIASIIIPSFKASSIETDKVLR